MHLAVRAGLSALLVRAVLAQASPDLAEVLKKIAKTYTVTQYELTVRFTAKGDDDRDVSGHGVLTFKGPNRYRVEGAIPGMSLGPMEEALVVYDGSAVWFYMPKSNQYGTFPASELTTGDLGDLTPQAMDHFIMWRYRGAVEFAENVKLLRHEPIEYQGAKVDCLVMSVGSGYTWWVDSARYLVLREDDAGSSATYTSIKLGVPLSDDLFKFKPPAGATKMNLHN